MTSDDKSKLRVYSTGVRNPFGVAIQGRDRNGDVWLSMNQQEEDTQGGIKPDEFHHSFYQADHGFPKWYQTDGNMRNAHLIGTNPPITPEEQVEFVDIQMNPLDDDITNWKTDPAALAAGFFNPTNSVSPWATLERTYQRTVLIFTMARTRPSAAMRSLPAGVPTIFGRSIRAPVSRLRL